MALGNYYIEYCGDFLSVLKPFDPWRSKLCTCPPKYTINPYTGCSHRCLYCYATAYIKQRKSKPKENIASRLLNDLRKFDPRYPIDMSLSSDPYPPEEEKYRVTRKILKILLPMGVKVQITTKSDLYLLDLDLISRYNVAVSITITTLDDSLARRLEPFAPSPSKRLKALEKLPELGVPFSVRIDPVIPYLNDDPETLRGLVREVVSIGAQHVVTSTYKARPDNFLRMIKEFPELEVRWRKLYYPRGRIKFGYAYLPIELRKKLLLPVTDEARKLGVTYATCREGLLTKEFFNTITCDGTHLIPIKTQPQNVKQIIKTKHSTLLKFIKLDSQEDHA